MTGLSRGARTAMSTASQPRVAAGSVPAAIKQNDMHYSAGRDACRYRKEANDSSLYTHQHFHMR